MTIVNIKAVEYCTSMRSEKCRRNIKDTVMSSGIFFILLELLE